MTFSLTFTGVDAASLDTYAEALTVSIAKEEPGLTVAPAAVWFEANVTGGASAVSDTSSGARDPHYHDITYVWDFGETTGTYLGSALNMPNVWKDTNRGYGKRVAHVFDQPDTYTVTVYAYEPATRRFGSATITVVVRDPDVEFPARRTIVYAPNGTSGLPVPPLANVQFTWAGALAAAAAYRRNWDGGSQQTQRLLLAPGADVTFVDAGDRIDTRSWENCRVGALDPGNATKPKLRVIGRSGGVARDYGRDCQEMVFYGIDFEGPWDAVNELGININPIQIGDDEQFPDNQLFMAHRCSFNGFTAVSARVAKINDSTPMYEMWSDLSITNWRDYGLQIGYPGASATNLHVAIIGASVAQHVDAMSGGAKSLFYNTHGPARIQSCASAYISVCDFFSRNGWGSTQSLNGDAVTAEQPAIRFNTQEEDNVSVVVDRFAAEGSIVLTPQGTVTPRPNPAGNYVFDKVLQVAGSTVNLGQLLGTNYSGFTLRNYLGVKLNLPEASTAGQSHDIRAFVGLSKGDGDETTDVGVAVYNAMGVDLRDNTNFREATMSLTEDGGVAFNDKTVENNLLHEPNRAAAIPGQTVDLATLTAGFAPRHNGIRHGFMHQSGALSADAPNGTGTLFVPYSQITRWHYSYFGTDTTAATDQAYWQATAATDTRHRIKVDGTIYFAEFGEMSVSFGATGVTITNTSGVDWPNGAGWSLQLDRTSRGPALDTTLYDSTTQTLGVVNATDPNTTMSGDTGLRAYDDYRLNPRPATGSKRGAVL